ncbi:Hypothetical predicted protein, partial [Pelobates cultripes]
MCTFLLLLCLVGSISTQESGDNGQEDYEIQNNIEPSTLSQDTSEDHLEDVLISDKGTVSKICPEGDNCKFYKFFYHHRNFHTAQ